MDHYYHNNFAYFLNIQICRKCFVGIYLILILSAILIIMLFNYEIVEIKELQAIVEKNEDLIIVNVPLSNTFVLTSGKELKINNQKVDFTILDISELNVDYLNNINYQEYKLKLNNYILTEFSDNQIITIKYENKRMTFIQKIWQNMKE